MLVLEKNGKIIPLIDPNISRQKFLAKIGADFANISAKNSKSRLGRGVTDAGTQD